MDYFDEINEAGCGFLNKLGEAGSNNLLIQIGTSKVAEREEYIKISENGFGPVRRIFTDETCEQYELYFPKYAVYQVLNETFIGLDGDDEFIGSSLRIYSKSRYLDYILENTGVYVYNGEKLTHYAILFHDHIIDIIAIQQPVITRIN